MVRLQSTGAVEVAPNVIGTPTLFAKIANKGGAPGRPKKENLDFLLVVFCVSAEQL